MQGENAFEKCAADRLVYGVVPADVFSDDFQFAMNIENSGSMNSASTGKLALMFLQERR